MQNLPVKDLTLWCLRSTKTRPKKQDLSVMRLVCLLYNLSVTRQGCYSFWLVNPDLTKKQDLHDMTLVCLQQQPVHSKTGLLLLSVLSTQTWPRKRIVCHETCLPLATTCLPKDRAVYPTYSVMPSHLHKLIRQRLSWVLSGRCPQIANTIMSWQLRLDHK